MDRMTCRSLQAQDVSIHKLLVARVIRLLSVNWKFRSSQSSWLASSATWHPIDYTRTPAYTLTFRLIQLHGLACQCASPWWWSWWPSSSSSSCWITMSNRRLQDDRDSIPCKWRRFSLYLHDWTRWFLFAGIYIDLSWEFPHSHFSTFNVFVRNVLHNSTVMPRHACSLLQEDSGIYFEKLSAHCYTVHFKIWMSK